jgi:hypothetical protein
MWLGLARKNHLRRFKTLRKLGGIWIEKLTNLKMLKLTITYLYLAAIGIMATIGLALIVYVII